MLNKFKRLLNILNQSKQKVCFGSVLCWQARFYEHRVKFGIDGLNTLGSITTSQILLFRHMLSPGLVLYVHSRVKRY